MQRHSGWACRDALKAIAITPRLELSPVAAVRARRVDRLRRACVPVSLIKQTLKLDMQRRRQLQGQVGSRLKRQYELAVDGFSILIVRVLRQRNLTPIFDGLWR
jgi:hypothetical protein